MLSNDTHEMAYSVEQCFEHTLIIGIIRIVKYNIKKNKEKKKINVIRRASGY